MNTDQLHIWAATAEVRPNPGNNLLEGAQGAYVPVVGIAESATAFEAAIRRAMSALEFGLVELADIRPLVPPFDRDQIDAVMAARIRALNADNPVEFGGFHTFA